MDTQIALLRGVNVGGKHKLPMADLRALFEEQGLSRVRTYIQSGNVVFEGDRPHLGDHLSRAITERFGFEVPVVLRTAEALHDVISEVPFATEGVDPRLVHVGFFSQPVGTTNLDTTAFAPDEAHLRPSHVYLRYPNGSARSKLTVPWLDRQLGVVTTARNWRTVLELARMCSGS